MAKRKVVVIDDSPTVRKLAEVVLAEEGYEVYTAEDGEEGLKIAEEVLPSVILVDFIMPRMNGYQFCKMVRSNEVLKDVPVILITAKGEDVGAKFAEKFGVVDYFIKPFQPEDLLEKVSSILGSRQTAGVEVVEFAAKETEGVSAVYSEDIEEALDKIIHRYFYKKLPSLLKNSLVDVLKHEGIIKAHGVILSGDLSEFSLFDIFQLIDTVKATGKLSVYSSMLSSDIYFEKGQIVYAFTSKQGKSLISGDLVRKKMNISQSTFSRTFKAALKKNTPLLRSFVDAGILSKDECLNFIRELIDDAIYSTMEIETGNFYFEKIPLPANLSDISIRLNISQFILEGARRIDERKYAAEIFKDNNIAFIRLMTDVAMEDIKLDEEELRVFSLVDGSRTIGDIIKITDIDENELKRILYTLTKVGILRKK